MMGQDRISRALLYAIFIGIGALTVGCNAPKDHLQTFDRFFEASDYQNSAIFAQQKLNCRKTPVGEDLLWTMQLGSIERIKHDCNKSTEYFDKAEDMLKYFDEQSKFRMPSAQLP